VNEEFVQSMNELRDLIDTEDNLSQNLLIVRGKCFRLKKYRSGHHAFNSILFSKLIFNIEIIESYKDNR